MAAPRVKITADSAILLALPRYLPTFAAVMLAQHEAVTALRRPDGVWEFHMTLGAFDRSCVQTSVPFNPLGHRIADEDEDGETLRQWGLRKLGLGVWALSDSIHLPGIYHAYVVLHDVPEPPPWA